MKIQLTILTFIVVFGSFLTQSCKKEVVNPPVAISDTTAVKLTVLFQGTFANGAHPTSGTVKLSKDADGKKFLVFENFKSDSGPDLRIYLSDDLKASNYTEITNKVINGSFQVAVDASIDTDKKRKVLIWCKAFSVLFGSAELK